MPCLTPTKSVTKYGSIFGIDLMSYFKLIHLRNRAYNQHVLFPSVAARGYVTEKRYSANLTLFEKPNGPFTNFASFINEALV